MTSISDAPRRPFTPYLRSGLEIGPETYASSTCFTAGYLVSPNAGWRSVRPVIDHMQCTLCLQCYMHCPDGTIYKVRDEEGTLVSLGIDYDFCKGCGVCMKVCPAPCIEMINEKEFGEGE
jgi:2-oxoacid:acceptor oxidoreductase delta subunit (pyruvate/2-ketoisovalerate family)